MALTREGRRDEAYDVARTAYLDHFERAEVPLRLRDANLVLDLEFQFAALRDGIRDGDSVDSVESTAATIREGLRDVDRTLADPGFAAPLIAFLFSFSILFREGVEAVLLIAILLGSLEAGRARGYRRPSGSAWRPRSRSASSPGSPRRCSSTSRPFSVSSSRA